MWLAGVAIAGAALVVAVAVLFFSPLIAREMLPLSLTYFITDHGHGH